MKLSAVIAATMTFTLPIHAYDGYLTRRNAYANADADAELDYLYARDADAFPDPSHLYARAAEAALDQFHEVRDIHDDGYFERRDIIERGLGKWVACATCLAKCQAGKFLAGGKAIPNGNCKNWCTGKGRCPGKKTNEGFNLDGSEAVLD